MADFTDCADDTQGIFEMVRMKTESMSLQSSCRLFQRQITTAIPIQGRPSKCAIFLDAEYYLERLDLLSIIESLLKAKQIPPTLFAFVSHQDSESRQRDFICNYEYNTFIANDLRKSLEQKYNQSFEADNCIAGLSLSGLASANIALDFPQLFPRCLSQSGSFWWNNDALTLRMSAKTSPNTDHLKFWLSVGLKETDTDVIHPPTSLLQKSSQIDAVRRFANALKVQGQTVTTHVFDGGHELEPWKKELPDALCWLLN